MAYEKQIWKDLPDTTTPITAERLNHIEDGIEENNNKIEEIEKDNINTFIYTGIDADITNIHSNAYELNKIPLEKKLQKGNETAFSISDGEIVIGENVSLVKITQIFNAAIMNSYCVDTQKNDVAINELRNYSDTNNGTNYQSSNAQRTANSIAIIEVNPGDKLKMVYWATDTNITNLIVRKEGTGLIIEKIA